MSNIAPRLTTWRIWLTAALMRLSRGQGFSIPQPGFRLNECSFNFSRSCVLLISHSGGTFSTLNCANLLKAFTEDLFVVTSEWDTQIARAVRSSKTGAAPSFKLASYVFSTGCGLRPAEPCSLTVAATHYLLTELLFYLMYSMRLYEPGHPMLCGSFFDIEEVRELEGLRCHIPSAPATPATPATP